MWAYELVVQYRGTVQRLGKHAMANKLSGETDGAARSILTLAAKV